MVVSYNDLLELVGIWDYDDNYQEIVQDKINKYFNNLKEEVDNDIEDINKEIFVNMSNINFVDNNITKDNIIKEITNLIDNKEEYDNMSKAINPYGDGNASKYIVDAIVDRYNNRLILLVHNLEIFHLRHF